MENVSGKMEDVKKGCHPGASVDSVLEPTNKNYNP
jgi:hypothetical protein